MTTNDRECIQGVIRLLREAWQARSSGEKDGLVYASIEELASLLPQEELARC